MRNDQIFVFLLVVLMPLSGCIGDTKGNQIEAEGNLINTEDCQTNKEDSQINFQPENRDELNTAIREWMSDSDGANSTYGDISTWNTSLITDMSVLFSYGTLYPNSERFNCDISDWDVSGVTDMSGMFSGREHFNRDISDWDVSSVTNMKRYVWEGREFQSRHFRMGCFKCN